MPFHLKMWTRPITRFKNPHDIKPRTTGWYRNHPGLNRKLWMSKLNKAFTYRSKRRAIQNAAAEAEERNHMWRMAKAAIDRKQHYWTTQYHEKVRHLKRKRSIDQ